MAGSVTDDAVTLTLGGESFSGVPSGPNVTYTDTPNPQWRESYLLPDGSFVSKFLGTSTVAGDTSFSRELSIDIPSSGLVILNATASPFDLAAGQNATLNFDLVPIGSPRPPINQWIVSVVQPNNTTNQPFYTFPALAGSQGPGTTSPVANGFRVNVPWDGKNAEGQVIQGDFSWLVTANVTVGSGTRQATLKLDQYEKTLKLNANAEPSSYDPQAGGNATLAFDLEARGLGSSPSFQWNVSITDSQGAELFEFPNAQGAEGPGDVTSSGTTRKVHLVWNGLDSNGNPVVPDFKWVINATAVQPGIGGDRQVARAEILNNNTAELLVQSGSSDRAHAYSPSTAALERTVVDPLLRRIFNANETYTIKATGLRFQGQRPNTITAEIKSNISGRTLLKTLTFNNTTQAFTGNFQTNEVIQPRPATTLYSTVAGNEAEFERVANLWGSLIGGSDTQNIYPGPKAQLGQLLARLGIFDEPDHAGLLAPALASTVDLADSDPVTGQTTDDSRNFFQYGFESITVDLKDEALQTKDLQTLQRVGHAADVVVVNCHGSQTGELSINPNTFFATLAPKPPLGDRPKQVVILSCAALDLRDYNNSFDLNHAVAGKGGHPSKAGLFQDREVDPDTGSTYLFTPRASYGGEAWFRSFAGQTVLLGYNANIFSPAVGEVTAGYRRRIAQGENAIQAWLRANREVGLNNGGLNWSAFNACAYDTNGDYYYISYTAPSINLEMPLALEFNPGDVLIRGIYKVPASRWSLQADDWSKPLQTSNGVPLAIKVE